MENNYLIREKPMKALILFALPIIIGNLFQQTYTMADSTIVSRYFGAKDYKKTITAIFTSIISFFFEHSSGCCRSAISFHVQRTVSNV